jgi:ribose transport system ATP-binding protein
MPELQEPLVKMTGIKKSYGAVQALKHADVEVGKGEVLGLIGANGAGKSTLIKILAGVVVPDEGEIVLGGEQVSFRYPREAVASGIALVPQELQLVGDQSVAHNIFLSRMSSRFGVVSNARMYRDAKAVLARVGLERIDPRTRAGDLAGVEARLITIAQALSLEPRVLILDEPSAALPTDVAELFGPLLAQLAASGTSTIYISHRLHEIMRLTDRVVAMRDGEIAGELIGEQRSIPRMIELIGGRALSEEPAKPAPASAESRDVVLRAEGLTGKRIQDVSFTVHAGEVVGIGGLYGSGRSELLRLLGGMQSPTDGNVEILGGSLPRNPVAAVKRGIGYLPEERRQMIYPTMDVLGNITITMLSRLSRNGMLFSRKREWSVFGEAAERTRLKGGGDEPIRSLSCGNQQKACIARALLAGPRVLLLDEPTVGVDVHARAEIHRFLIELAAEGMTIIVASADPEELVLLCPRVLTLIEGRMGSELLAPFDADKIVAASYDHGHEAAVAAAA